MAKQATHKLSGLGMIITTTLDRGELPEIVTAAAADGQASNVLVRDGQVHVEHVAADEIQLAVRTAFKRVVMTLTVAVSDSALDALETGSASRAS